MYLLISQIAAELKKLGIVKASLFGSYSRGENNDASDLDILIQPSAHMSLLDVIRIENQLSKILNKKVDIITFNSVNPLLKDIIFRDVKTIL